MKEIIQTLEELIKIPSVSSDFEQSERIITYIQDYFACSSGAQIDIYRFKKYPSIVVSNFKGKDADLILNGHVDVVPPSEDNQFTPILDGKKIIARGSGDMKAGVAIMMKLMKEVLELSYTDKKIALIITTDEELGGENGAQEIVNLGYTGKGVLVPDSGDDNTIVIAEKGIFDVTVKVGGKSCHASRPWLGENAIENAYNIYNKLQEHIQDNEKLNSKGNWGSSVNLTKISSGTATNVIPDECMCYFDIRVTEDFPDMEHLLTDIKSIVANYNGEVIEYLKGDLVYTDPNHSFIQSYIDSYREIRGQKPNINKEHGASDGRFFASKGMPLLLHRPTCENIHSKNEWVDTDSVENIYNIYKHFIFENDFVLKK